MAMMAQAGGLFRLSSRAECVATKGRWIVEQFVPLADFLGRPPGCITPADREGVDLELYAALLRKDEGARHGWRIPGLCTGERQ
jgi:hypothetical protein